MNGYSDAAQSTPVNIGLGVVGLIVLAIVLGIGLIVLVKSFFTVEQQSVYIIERLGKFHRTAEAGMHARNPFIDRIVEEIGLQLEQMAVEVQVLRTRTGEYITLPVTVQYRVIADQAHTAFYAAADPDAAIMAHVQNEVMLVASGMSLDDIFASRDTIKNSVIETLAAEIGAFGYTIVTVLVDNPVVADAIMAAANDVSAAQQRQRAAIADAEALKTRRVGEATAEAEALKIRALAAAKARTTLAEGNGTAVLEMTKGTDLPDSAVLAFLALLDTNEAVREAAHSGSTVVVATGNPADGLFATLPQRPLLVPSTTSTEAGTSATAAEDTAA